jgi:hypothetical protein
LNPFHPTEDSMKKGSKQPRKAGPAELGDKELESAAGGGAALTAPPVRKAKGGGEVAIEELSIAHEGLELD